MRNRPQISWDPTAYDRSDADTPAPDESPTLRFCLLFVALLCPVTAIGARLAHLQARLGPVYVAAWETTTTDEEPLPCRDGRILSADGQVLAQDRLRFDILVHYRWLEDPVDEGWLRQRAFSRLSRRQRRDPARVTAAKEAILLERRRLWTRLAATTGRRLDELDRERAGIQQRVERIVESVTRRRDAQLAEADEARATNPAVFTTLASVPVDFGQLGDAIVDELTRPPTRSAAEPIIVSEELEHHVVVRDVDLRVVAEIESAPSMFPGVRVQTSSERIYPAHDTASHIIGVRTDVTAEELDHHGSADGSETFREGDRIGRTGIERALDQFLRGRPGLLRIVMDRRGEVVSQSVVQPPVHGRDVVLTIDAQLQRQAEQLLDAAITHTDQEDSTDPPDDGPASGPDGACLIVMDVRTGDVLMAAAAPRFDLGLLLHPDPAQWQAATSDPRRPFFPRITQMTIPPGSVFKILTAIALLESRLIDPDEPVFCQGYLDRPDRNRCYIYRHYGIGHGDMTLTDAICQSCNVYFFHAARSLGPQPIAEWAARFGFGAATGSEVPGEKAGHLPRANAGGEIVGEEWYDGSTLQFAIGQSSLTVTPLQVARMVAAVANDGYLVTPRFVRDERGEQLTDSSSMIELATFASPTAEAADVQRIPGLSPGTLARIREGMRLVVEHPQGTGKRVRMDDISIAGKTGTAELGGGQPDHAWFVGFVPADVPRYAFVIVLEHGGSGGSAAAPIAKQLIEAMANAGVLSRRESPHEDESSE